MKTECKTTKTVKENPRLNFMSSENSLYNFKDFLVLINTTSDVKLKLYYRLTDDGFMQLAYAYAEEAVAFSSTYKRKFNTLKENLSFLLKEFLRIDPSLKAKLIYGYSILFIKKEYDAILEEMCSKKKSQQENTKVWHTPLIQYLIEQGLAPKPTGLGPNSWVANCPNAAEHSMVLDTIVQEWGCGYCERKGKLPELKAWLAKLK